MIVFVDLGTSTDEAFGKAVRQETIMSEGRRIGSQSVAVTFGI